MQSGTLAILSVLIICGVIPHGTQHCPALVGWWWVLSTWVNLVFSSVVVTLTWNSLKFQCFHVSHVTLSVSTQLSPQFLGSVLQNFSLKAPWGCSSPWGGLVEVFSQSCHWHSDSWRKRWQGLEHKEVMVILKSWSCVVALSNKGLHKEDLCLFVVSQPTESDQETNDTISSVLSCFQCLVQVKCYQTLLFCLQKNVREQWTACGRRAFLIWKKSIYFGAMKWHWCWRPRAESWHWQRDFYKDSIILSLCEYLIVFIILIFLWSCNKNKFYMYNTRIYQGMFPLCPCSLMSLYLSTSRDLPCPLFCSRTGNHWVL